MKVIVWTVFYLGVLALLEHHQASHAWTFFAGVVFPPTHKLLCAVFGLDRNS